MICTSRIVVGPPTSWSLKDPLTFCVGEIVGAKFDPPPSQLNSTKTVSLIVTPKYHSVVKEEGRSSFWQPTIAVEEGTITLHVGGGQPGFTKGVLSASVNVTRAGALNTGFACVQD